MRRLALAASVFLVTTVAAHAQQPTLGTPQLISSPGTAVTLTVRGTAGHSFAVIGSTTWGGVSYAGVDLFVGQDFVVLGIGVLDGSGVGTATFTPPFPVEDRYYTHAVTSTDGFATITPTNRLTLLNSQEARLYMPIGGFIFANGTPAAISPGVTVTKSGSTYTISHPNHFEFALPVPSVTVSGNATITSIQGTTQQTVVTLSADANFTFAIQTFRR